MMELKGLHHYWKDKSVNNKFIEYIYIYRYGKIKGEHTICCHILPCVAVTRSGIDAKLSLAIFLDLKAS